MIDNSFVDIPHTGVIRMMAEARESGFFYGNEEWSNLGQGAPEVGELPNGNTRLRNIPLSEDLYEYAPAAGLPALRSAVAEMYNKRFRNGMPTQYTSNNVCIVGGGRLALSRICAAMSNVNLGHVIPDYTAYTELLSVFNRFTAIPISLRKEDGFSLTPAKFRESIVDFGLGAFLLSNPCNPTGSVASGKDVQSWIDIAERNQCTLILDEFYSHYLYGESARADGPALSGARYVEDINKSATVIIDGITKNWRYPGLRISWIVGPESLIDKLRSIGSFLDGGAPKSIQNAILPLITADVADAEALSIQGVFQKKLDLSIRRVSELGMKLYAEPSGAFYCFASLENMPEGIRDGYDFAQAALKEKVIVIPGEYFDINPGKRRSHVDSRLKNYIRISFGPNIGQVAEGFDKLEALINASR